MSNASAQEEIVGESSLNGVALAYKPMTKLVTFRHVKGVARFHGDVLKNNKNCLTLLPEQLYLLCQKLRFNILYEVWIFFPLPLN